MADKPPKLKDYPYDKWVLLVTIWSEQFITDPKSRANRVIILALEGDDQDAALEIGQTELNSDEGLELLIRKLDEKYKVDDATRYISSYLC